MHLQDGRTCSFNLGVMKEKDLSSKKERMMRRIGPAGHAAAFLHYIEDQQNEVKSKQKHRSKFSSSFSSQDSFLECVASAEAIRLLRLYHNDDKNGIVSKMINDRINSLVEFSKGHERVSLLELSQNRAIVHRALASFQVAGSFKDPVYVGGSICVRNCSNHMVVVKNETGTLLKRDGDFVEIGYEDRCERLHHSTIIGTNISIEFVPSESFLHLLEWVLRHYLQFSHFHGKSMRLNSGLSKKVIRAPVLEKLSTSVSVSSAVSSTSSKEGVEEEEKDEEESVHTKEHSIGFALLVSMLECMMSILTKHLASSSKLRGELSNRSNLMEMLVKLASAYSSTNGHPLSEVRYQGIDSLRHAVLRVEESVLDFTNYSKMSKDFTSSPSFSLSKIDEEEKVENYDNDKIFASLPKICDSTAYLPYAVIYSHHFNTSYASLIYIHATSSTGTLRR